MRVYQVDFNMKLLHHIRDFEIDLGEKFDYDGLILNYYSDIVQTEDQISLNVNYGVGSTRATYYKTAVAASAEVTKRFKEMVANQLKVFLT